VAAPTLRRAGNLSMGHQDTRKILKRKKRTDQIHLEDQGTGNTLNPSET